MLLRQRRWTRRTGMLLAALLGSTTAFGPPAREESCAATAAWLLDTPTLPTSLAEFGKLPMSRRRAAYRTLPTAIQKDLWRQHLASFLTDSSHLNAYQKRRVREIRDSIDQYLLLPNSRTNIDGIRSSLKSVLDKKHPPLPDTLQKQLVRTFGAQNALLIFATIGPLDSRLSNVRGIALASLSSPIDFLGAAAAQRLMTFIGSPSRVNQETPTCTCSRSSSYCWVQDYNYMCGSLPECICTNSGCGTWFNYPCDGTCGYGQW